MSDRKIAGCQVDTTARTEDTQAKSGSLLGLCVPVRTEIGCDPTVVPKHGMDLIPGQRADPLRTVDNVSLLCWPSVLEHLGEAPVSWSAQQVDQVEHVASQYP